MQVYLKGGSPAWGVYVAGDGDNSSPDTYVDNTWEHVAYVRNGTNHKVYVNGIQKVNFTDTAADPGGTHNISAFESPCTSAHINGYVSDWKVWEAALSAPELVTDMAEGVQRASNLWAYYPFTADFNDASGNARHLTEVGAGSVTIDAAQPTFPVSDIELTGVGATGSRGTVVNSRSILIF